MFGGGILLTSQSIKNILSRFHIKNLCKIANIEVVFGLSENVIPLYRKWWGGGGIYVVVLQNS